MKNYLLIKTVGITVETKPFASFDEAKKEIEREIELEVKGDGNENFSVCNTHAWADTLHGMITWNIVPLKDEFTWDELYAFADGAACGSAALKAKDTARGELERLILEGWSVDINEYESPEEAIDGFLREEKPYVYIFTKDGVFVRKELLMSIFDTIEEAKDYAKDFSKHHHELVKIGEQKVILCGTVLAYEDLIWGTLYSVLDEMRERFVSDDMEELLENSEDEYVDKTSELRDNILEWFEKLYDVKFVVANEIN